MLYRVLSVALLGATPAAAAIATMPAVPVTSAPAPEASPLAAHLYGFRATGLAAPHPLSDAEGNWMWDALGGGCIDGGDWADPFPGGKGDMRAETFCIPQPCVRVLTPEELARDVLGRELEDGDYRTYLRRLEEACGQIPASPANAEGEMDLDELLKLASLDWVMSAKGTGDFEPEAYVPVAWEAAPPAEVEWVYPPGNRRQQYASIVPTRPSTARGAGGGSSSRPNARAETPDGPQTGLPTPDEPGTETPGTDKPGTHTPGTDTPGTDKPGTDTPGTDTPGTDTPGTDKPGTDTPGTDTPGTDTPGTDTPGTDTPGTDTPGTDTPGTDTPGTDTPGTDTPGTDMPGTDTPGTDTPGTDTPGTDTPGTDTPGTDGPGPDLPEPPTFPEVPDGPLDPDGPDGPGGPDGPSPQEPAPVPLPGGLPLLVVGIAALALGRRRAA